MDFPDLLPPLVSFVHRSREVFHAKLCISTELLLIGSSWLIYPCLSVWSTLLMSSLLLLQQCPTYLTRLTWMVFKMGGRYPYSCCFVGCCLQDLFSTACNILVQLPSSLVSIHVVHPCSSIDTTTAWKKLRFILSDGSDFHMTDSLSMALHAFASHVLMLMSFRSMRCCFWGRWTYPLVSVIFHLVLRCCLFN